MENEMKKEIWAVLERIEKEIDEDKKTLQAEERELDEQVRGMEEEWEQDSRWVDKEDKYERGPQLREWQEGRV